MVTDHAPPPSDKATAADLEKVSLDTVYATLSTSAQGLTSAEATSRLTQYGRNELVEKEVSNLEKFLRFFWGPIAWMIEAAAFLSLLMGHWADLTIILVLMFYNAISGFWQERKASDALAALKAGMAPRRRPCAMASSLPSTPPRSFPVTWCESSSARSSLPTCASSTETTSASTRRR